MPRPESPRRRGYKGGYFGNKRAILARRPVCYRCKTNPATEVDHVVPLVQGGSNHVSNLRPICAPCNRKSGGGVRRLRKSVMVAARVQAALIKASFGGDRSAAGRYAANIRWQTRVDSDKPSGRTPAQQELLDDFESPQDKVPRSPKNPQGLNPKAIRSWVDGPFPQSVKNFPINDYMRHIANGLLGLPLNTYRKLPTGVPRKGDRIGPSPDWRTTTDQVKNLLESIDKAPPEQPTLWRGMSGRYGRDGGGDQQVETAQRLLATKEGDTLQIPFMSTSRDKGIASLLYGQHLAEQGDPPSVIMRIEKGAKGVATSIIPNDHEVITSGKFVVTAKTETTVEYQSGGVTYSRPVVLISVKQVDTFGPEDYKDAGFLPSWQHEIRKASFGGDRSAAGRYAAEQRWKGHVVQSDKSDVAGRAETIKTTLSQSAESAKNRITKVFSKENLVRNFGDSVDDAIVDDANKRVKATVEAIDSTVKEINKLLDSMVAGEAKAMFRVPDAVKKEIAKLGALERKLYKQIHTIDPTSFVNPSNPFDTGLPQRKGDSVQRPNPTTPSGKVAAAQWFVVHSLSVELKTVVHQVDALSQKLILEKASFGGDRSAAGRYAAEQRWKGHVKGGKSASVVMDESRLSWLTKPTDTSSEDFTKRIVERLVEKFSFFELSAAVLMQLSMSYPKEGQQALRLLNAYKEELSGAKNSKEVGIIVNEIISRQGAQPRIYDSWETEELELIRLSGSIGDMQSDSLTQADRLVHTLKQGWTVGSQKGRAQVAALTGQSLGASSNRTAEQDYERKDADELTKIMNTDEGYAAKQVLTALVKEVYDDTQRLIKEKLPEGTTHVRLFRGTALTEEQLRDAKDGLLDVAVTSSWTSSPKIAGDFRGTYKPKWDAMMGRRKLEEVKITALVPIGSIFAVGLQGFGGKGEREVLVLGPSVEVQRVVPSTEAVGKDLAYLIKASFGGDRSAAGRYAAEQRWKGHVKKEPKALTVDNIPKDALVYVTTGLEATEQQKRLAKKLVDSMTIDELRSALRLVFNSEPWKTEDAYAIAERILRGLGHAWQYQGGESSAGPLRAAVLHRSVMRVFGEGISGKEETGAGAEYGDWAKQREEQNPAGVKAVDAIVKAMYDETQAMFADAKAAGYTHIVMYRGTAMERELTGGYEEVSVPLRSMTSWSVSLGAAENFRGEMRLGELKDGTPVMLTAKIPIERIFLAQSLVGGRYIEDEMVVLGPSIDAIVEETIPALGGYNFQKSLADLLKASFGGDRSAAGRYAAEQRWKGHVKQEGAGSPPSGGAGDFMRLINGTPQTYTVKGVIQVHGFGIEGGISRGHYDDLVKADPNEEGNSTGVWQTTAGEFRRMATSGELDLSPKWVDHVVRSLREHSDDTRVAVELGVDAIIVRNQPIVPIRPDQPHTAKDIVSIGQAINSSAQIDEDWGLNNDTDKKLTVNTSPRNKGPVKSGTLSRWEKGWETDYNNLPYCKEIASHAAYLMGQVDAPVERWGRDRRGSRAPSEAMLAQDAKDLLASINQGVEGQPVLWRGLEPSRSATKGLVDKAQVGDTLTLGLASTSRDAVAAAKYTQAYSGESKPIIMRIEEGSKGVSLGDRALYRHDQEVITSGKFEVVEVQTVTVPRWQMPSLGVETIQPSERIAIAQQALPKVKALLPPQQYAAIERSVEREAQKRVEYEKQTVTVKIVSVRQTETFDPETKEFEANG